jgi:hypothetical protein
LETRSAKTGCENTRKGNAAGRHDTNTSQKLASAPQKGLFRQNLLANLRARDVGKDGPAESIRLLRSKQFLKFWLDSILDQQQRRFGIGSALHRFMMYMLASMILQATLDPMAASKS